MIRKARRLIEYFKELASPQKANCKKSKANEQKAENAGELPAPALKPSSSKKRLSLTKKDRKKRNATSSLPTALNNDLNWTNRQKNGHSDSSSPPSSIRLNSNHKRAQSETGLKRAHFQSGKPLQSILRLSTADPDDPIALLRSLSNYGVNKPRDKLQVAISDSNDSYVESIYVADKLEDNEQVSPTDDYKLDRERRKAAAFNVQVSAEGTIETYNEELMEAWESVMAREIEAVEAQYNAQKSELIAEILFREDKQPVVNARRGRERRASSVVFNDTVEVCEVAKDGSLRNSSTTILFDQQRPRPLSKRAQSRQRKSSGLRFPNSPPPSPPASKPTPPLSSPQTSPFSSPNHSPTSSPVSSPTTSPVSSPVSSPTTPRRPDLPRHKLRGWAKVFSRRNSGILKEKQTDSGVELEVGEREAMEEEIARVSAQFELDKLALLEEIEIREACARLENERSELLAEIARRESTIAPGVVRGPGVEKAKRHALRMHKTLLRYQLTPAAQREEDNRIAREIMEVNAQYNGKTNERVITPKRYRRAMRGSVGVWRKNGSMRLVRRRAAIYDAKQG